MRIAPGAKCAIVTDANVAPLYLSRLTASLERAGLRSSAIVCPAGRSNEVLRRICAGFRRADRSAHRAPRHRRRARRGRHRRSDGILRGFPPQGRALCSGPHHAPVASRFQRRRKDGDQFAARQESCRRVPPAGARSRRFEQPRYPERARVSRRATPKSSSTASSATVISSNFSKLVGAKCSLAAPHAPRRSRSVVRPRPASSPPTRPSRASVRCSISATPSVTPSRA